MKKLLAMALALVFLLGVSAMAEEAHTIALANINEKAIFGKQVKAGFELAAEKRGWNLIYVDNNSDGATAVNNAQILALRGDIEYLVDMNVDQSVGQTIMDIFNDAGIGVIACDIALPGAPFYGIDSNAMGAQNGAFMADWVKANWDGEVDYAVLITQIASGDEVQKRCRSAIAPMEEAGVKIGEVVEIEGENDASVVQRRMTDFLTAHPDSEKILVFCINENGGQGALSAAEVSARESDVRIVSCNLSNIFYEQIFERNGESCWFATCANFPDQYGEEALQLMERAFAGEALEGVYACSMAVVTFENIDQYFPADKLPWNTLL